MYSLFFVVHEAKLACMHNIILLWLYVYLDDSK